MIRMSKAFGIHGLKLIILTDFSFVYVRRYANLNDLSALRAQKLEDSKKLQQFLRDAEEARIPPLLNF